MNRRAQAFDASSQESARTVDGPAEAREFRYGWIDAKAARRYVGAGSLSALYRLIREHQLPYRRVGRLYRFRRADLDQWMERSVGLQGQSGLTLAKGR